MINPFHGKSHQGFIEEVSESITKKQSFFLGVNCLKQNKNNLGYLGKPQLNYCSIKQQVHAEDAWNWYLNIDSMLPVKEAYALITNIKDVAYSPLNIVAWNNLPPSKISMFVDKCNLNETSKYLIFYHLIASKLWPDVLS